MEADLRRTRSPREAAAASEAMVAGCVAGSIGQLVGFPLDTLKVRTQLQATREMALFSGWRVPVATAGAINCANFGVYDSAWRSLSDVDDDVDAPSSVVFAAGACGGFVISPVSTVISRVKVLQQSCAFPGMNVRDVCRSLVEGGGMRSLWCGFSANFCMECCRGFYMLFFVGAKRYLGGESKDLALWKRSLAGAFAGVASWIVVYPLDVVKTAVQAQNPLKGERTSTREMALRLCRDGGIGRFYRGLGFTVLRAGPVAGVLLPTFDLTLYFLRKLR